MSWTPLSVEAASEVITIMQDIHVVFEEWPGGFARCRQNLRLTGQFLMMPLTGADAEVACRILAMVEEYKHEMVRRHREEQEGELEQIEPVKVDVEQLVREAVEPRPKERPAKSSLPWILVVAAPFVWMAFAYLGENLP